MELLKKFDLKIVKVKDMKEWSINPRIHSEKGVEDVATSIAKFDLVDKMFLDNDLSIIGGHARKKSLIINEITETEVFVAKELLTEKEYKIIALLTNATYTELDTESINEKHSEEELLYFGFSDEQIIIDDTDYGEMDDVSLSDDPKPKIKIEFNSQKELDEFREFQTELAKVIPGKTIAKRFINFLISKS